MAVNPLGTGGDLTKAAEEIRGILNPEPEGQPEAQEEATQEANQGDEIPAEPEATALTAEDDEPSRPEGADIEDAEPEDEGEAETPDDEAIELAGSLDGLAEQLGIERNDLLSHVKAEVKIQGETREVTLSDLISGHQMESDYRIKTAELAEQRRSFEEGQAAINQARDELEQKLTPLVADLEKMVVTDQQELDRLLNEGDMLQYETLKRQNEQRAAQLELAKQEQAKIHAERQEQAKAELIKEIQANEAKLAEVKPDWVKDQVKGRQELDEIKSYLKTSGIPAEVADSLYDVPTILVAEKAMMWDRLQKSKPQTLKKAKSAPKFQKPGASKPATDPTVKVHRANLNRLRKSGSVRDAANALKSGGFV